MSYQTKSKRIKYCVIVFLFSMTIISVFADTHFKVIPQKAIIQYNSAEGLYEKGISQLKNGNVDKAMKYFDRSIKKFEYYADSYFAKSMILYQMKEWDLALKYIIQSKEKYPILFNMNRELQKKKLNSLRIEGERIDKALSRLYGDSRKDCRYGIALNRLNARKERANALINNLSGDSEPIANINPPKYDFLHGNILMKLNRLDQAKEQYHKTILSDPTHSFAHNNLASIYYQQERYPESLDVIWQAEANGIKMNTLLKTNTVKKIQINDLKETTGSSGLFRVKKFKVNVGDKNDVFFENIYLLYHTEKHDAVIIDPGKPSKEVSAFIQDKSLKVVFILNTHAHDDHTGANRHFSTLYKVPVVAHYNEKTMLKGKGSDQYRTHFFANETEYTINDITFKIFHIPGHTAGSVCYLIDDLLFSGDILFYDSIGKLNVSLTKQSEEQMAEEFSKNIVKSLGNLLPQTKIFPGHGIGTTWERERKMNPFISLYQ